MRITQTPPTFRRPFPFAPSGGPDQMFVVNADELSEASRPIPAPH
jgi:hypothetical protein